MGFLGFHTGLAPPLDRCLLPENRADGIAQWLSFHSSLYFWGSYLTPLVRRREEGVSGRATPRGDFLVSGFSGQR